MQLHRPKYRSSIARTQQDVDAVQRLRFVSIGTDLNIRIAFDPRVGREVSGFDNLSTSYNLLLTCGQTPVATARLALPNPEVALASGTDFGFEIEGEVDLREFYGIGRGLAEIARVCVLPAWQCTPAVLQLYESIYCLSRELGVSHWIGTADCRTSRADEAARMFTALEQRGLVDRRFHAGVRSPHGTEAGEDAPARDVRISRTVTAFARRLGARCVGRPVHHPAFPRFVLPMLVSLEAFPRETLSKFDLSLLVPTVAPEPLMPPSRIHDRVALAERMAS